jgi:hypothetical protein
MAGSNQGLSGHVRVNSAAPDFHGLEMARKHEPNAAVTAGRERRGLGIVQRPR